MKMGLKLRKVASGIAGLALAGGMLYALKDHSVAQAENESDMGRNARCATRLSVSLLGSAATPELLQSSNPQSAVDSMLADPVFVERFARFINSEFNDGPGATTEEDGPYHVAKYVLAQKQPWKNLFVGPIGFTLGGTAAARTVTVVEDANGLGYFRTQPWLLRYAGNELTGIKLTTAYRMMNNAIGLKLTATTNAPGADVSAAGRASPACKSCHYENYWALDQVASVLSKVVRNGNNTTFTPPDGTAKAVLGGIMVKDDKELVTAMVESEQFAFNVCRTAFNYLYARPENACEGPTFDACVEAFKNSGLMQDALGAIAKDPNFCQ